MAKAKRGDKLALLARQEQKLAELRRLRTILDELDELVPETLYGLSYSEIRHVSAQITILTSEADRLIRKHKMESVEKRDWESAFKFFKDAYRAMTELQNEMDRMDKIEQHKQEREAREEAARRVQQSLCVKCGKKPARINEYCKRCAREEGIIVRGKI